MAFSFEGKNNELITGVGSCNFGSIVQDAINGDKYLVCDDGHWLRLAVTPQGSTRTVSAQSLSSRLFKHLPVGTSFTFTSEK